MKTVAVSLVWLAWFCLAQTALAQPFLEKLEQQVRQQLQPPSQQPPPGADAAEQVPERGYLGIVTDDRQDRGRGVRILEVRPGGPGEKSGLRVQDLITGLGGIRVRQTSDLAAIFEQVPPNGTLAFEILRGQQRMNFEVTFGRRPPPAKGPPAEPAPPSEAKPAGPELVVPDVPGPPAAKAAPSTAPQPLPSSPAGPPPTATDRSSTDRQRIEALERRVRQLEERLQQLERALLEKR